MKIGCIILHQTNTSSQTVQQTFQHLFQNKVTVLENPLYLSDLSMCDFWLFNNLNENLRRIFLSEYGIDQFSADIPKEALNFWKIRMQNSIDIKI